MGSFWITHKSVGLPWLEDKKSTTHLVHVLEGKEMIKKRSEKNFTRKLICSLEKKEII